MNAYQFVPKLIAHRGASEDAPENTLAAIRLAHQQGANWVEVDIAVTNDGVPVIFHDNTLHRTTNGEGLLLKMSFAEIATLSAGSWFDEKYANETIPTLEQLLTEVQTLGIGLNLEIKPTPGWDIPTVEAMAPIIKSHWKGDLPLLLSSFSQDALIKSKELLPEYTRALNTDAIPYNWDEKLQALGCSGIHIHYPFAEPALIQQVKEKGYSVLCFTVNDPQIAEQLFSIGVNGVFTDRPLALSQELTDGIPNVEEDQFNLLHESEPPILPSM